ncbi:cAMP-dependent protein kinase catalytic subunit alpha [Phytophthora cinnamomi]|uniref:cAMP-dependent protein kinase catalytic subunit alpha n=1 Tax=Phytophthora cinnamomi TaxID=4785 RepID=UPI00355A69B3|nr:cAMP-dependent protein kinase catalytic subunit alpha [Phytophthora cinnamomi]
MEEGDNMLSSIHNTMFSTHDLDLASEMDYHQLSEDEDEDDSGDDESSDDEEQGFFGTGMFGASADSRRLSGNAFGLPDDEMNNFTDVRRFQNAHSRRPSYPTGTGAKKSKKYREYLHPGQAFGEMSLLMNYKRTANIRAITFVEMCVLGRKQFQQIISRYPEDRRRVLTAMLESCIEKKVIPFPWENIIEAVSAKRRSSGKKDISRANVIATMTAKEAARILVEAIDINAPDETIKYGFQSFDEGFIEDSSLRQANAADVKISDTLQRRRSSIRSLKSLSARTAMPDITDNDLSEETSRSSGGAEFETSSTSTSPSTPLRAMQSDKTLKNLLLLVESMAGNIARLQQDVSDLKNRDITPCSRCS